MNNSRGSSRRRKYVGVELSKYNDKQKDDLTDLLCHQDKDLVFDKQDSENYIAHIQFVNSPERSKSPNRDVSKTKQSGQGQNLNDTGRPATKSFLDEHPNSAHPNRIEEQPSFTRAKSPSPMEGHSLKDKLAQLDRFKPLFPEMELRSIPVLRPNLIGRMFMTEKMEQCYNAATNDWVQKRNDNLQFARSIDSLLQKIYSKSRNVYQQNLMNLLYSAEKLDNYLDVQMFLWFVDGRYSQKQFLWYILFRQIFSEVTKIDLFAHNKLKTDPTKLILTREVCEEMLLLGLGDKGELLNKVRSERDKEFDRNNYIEYHIFMKIIVETIPESDQTSPSEVLHRLFFMPQESKQNFGNDSQDSKDNIPVDEVLDLMDKSKPQGALRDGTFTSPERPLDVVDRNGSTVKPKNDWSKSKEKSLDKSRDNTEPRIAGRERSKSKGSTQGLASPSKRKVGGINGGRGGDFYIGLDECNQSDIQLYFRAHFTCLIERFIDSILEDKKGPSRDQTYTEEEMRANILSVVNRKCQNLLTAIFSGNRANFIRLLMMRRESGAVAVNVDEIFYRWNEFRDRSPINVDEKSANEYLKKILRIEQLATNISRYILYTTCNLSDILDI